MLILSFRLCCIATSGPAGWMHGVGGSRVLTHIQTQPGRIGKYAYVSHRAFFPAQRFDSTWYALLGRAGRTLKDLAHV